MHIKTDGNIHKQPTLTSVWETSVSRAEPTNLEESEVLVEVDLTWDDGTAIRACHAGHVHLIVEEVLHSLLVTAYNTRSDTADKLSPTRSYQSVSRSLPPSTNQSFNQKNLSGISSGTTARSTGDSQLMSNK